MTCCVEKREIFFLGRWVFAVGESLDEEEGEIGEERVD